MMSPSLSLMENDNVKSVPPSSTVALTSDPNQKTSDFVEKGIVEPSITPDTSENGSSTFTRDTLASFLADYTLQMSQQTSKRGKRRNAVNLYASSTSPIKEKIIEEYNGALFDDDVLDKDDVDIHLHAAQYLLEQFLNAQDSISEMSEYLPTTIHEEGYPTAQSFILTLIETHIFAQFSKHFDDPECVQSLAIVSWIDDTVTNLDKCCPNVKKGISWQSTMSHHKKCFLMKGIRSSLQSVVKRQIAVLSDNDNSGCTNDEIQLGCSEEIASAIDAQVVVVKRYSKEWLLSEILIASNEEILQMITDIMLILSTKWKVVVIKHLSSTINDSLKLSELVQQRNLLYISNHESKMIGNKTVQDISELSTCAINLLSERIMYDLQHPDDALSSIGGHEWQLDEHGTAIGTTLQSFRQILDGIKDFFPLGDSFPRLLKNCFNLTLQVYVNSFYTNTLSAMDLNPEVVATNLQRDYLNFVIFFNGSLFEDNQDKEGFYSTCEVNRRLQVIQCMSRLMNPAVPPSELEDDTVRFLTLISLDKENATAALFHIAGLLNGHCDDKSSEWIQMITNAEKILIKEKPQTLENLDIQLPDLRNSPYVRKIYGQHQYSKILQRHIANFQQFRFYRKINTNKDDQEQKL